MKAWLKTSVLPPVLLSAFLVMAMRSGTPIHAGAPGEDASRNEVEIRMLKEENARLKAATEDLIVKYNRAIQDLLRVSAGRQGGEGEGKDPPALSHDVFFSLKDRSLEAREKLVAACRKLPSSGAGILSFACGTLAESVAGLNQDRDFDVALHVAFEDAAALDRYRKDPRHAKFVEENGARWEKVRVFDSVVKVAAR